MTIEEKYKEVLALLEKHKDLGMEDFTNKIKCKLWETELKEKYGILLKNSIGNLQYIHLQEFLFLAWYGEKYNRTISWEDTGKQPEDELLLQICFPTGGYIFGEKEHNEVFKDFFTELKTYPYKYIDSVNKCLYYTLENAGKISVDFRGIFDKHYAIYRGQAKQREINELQARIDRLK